MASQVDVSAMFSVANQLLLEERTILTTQFNTLLRQFVEGLARIVPSQRTQLDLAAEALKVTPLDVPMYITEMGQFLLADKTRMQRIVDNDVTLLTDAATIPENPVPFAELQRLWGTLSDKSRANVWTFLNELAARAYTVATTSLNMESMRADLDAVMADLPAWQDEWARTHGGAPPNDAQTVEWVRSVVAKRAAASKQ